MTQVNTHWLDNNSLARHIIECEVAYPLKFACVFHTKEEYLKWVQMWKDEYKPLAERQREIRKIITQPHTVIKKTEWYLPNTHRVGEYDVGSLMHKKIMNRWRLRWLLEKRKEAKERAGRQRERSLNNS